MIKEDLGPVWKALADPSRREMLDVLREGPRTTGDLCRRFAFSRFAVMKHLGILEKAGLVVVRRQGRERWNHLNTMPIREIYERWVRRYETLWTDRMLRLRDQIESRKREEPMSNQLA